MGPVWSYLGCPSSQVQSLKDFALYIVDKQSELLLPPRSRVQHLKGSNVRDCAWHGAARFKFRLLLRTEPQGCGCLHGTVMKAGVCAKG